MNEEYLWDKSGEPDPEIRQLEEILGTLRYQPKPLALPESIQPVRRHHYLPLIAIAATLLVVLLGAGLWLKVRNETTPPQIVAGSDAPTVPREINSPTPKNADNDELATKPEETTPRREPPLRHVKRSNSSQVARLTKQERKEALAAKNQLMLALRLASEKLNLAQRRVQNPSQNQTRNQHKIG